MTDNGENYEALIHNLKVKILAVKERLPRYDRFDEYEINTDLTEEPPALLRSLKKQRIIILRAINEMNAMYASIKGIYDELTSEYRKAPKHSKMLKSMDELENQQKMAQLIDSLEWKNTNLNSIKIEIEETIEHEQERASERAMERNQAIHHQQPENIRVDDIKLTNVIIPEFDGEPENFSEFICSFEELVHRNNKISAIEKATRLKSALKGKAALCIKGIAVTSESYEVMYNKVKRKFQKIAVNKHVIMQKLEQLSTAGVTAAECNNKLTEIEIILNQLDSAESGISDSTNVFFHRLILQKFPQHIRKALISKTKRDNFSVQDLIDALENKIFDDEFAEQATIGNGEYMAQRATGRSEPRNLPTQPTYINERTHPHTQRGYIKQGCVFCGNNNHSADRCRIPLVEKIQILKRNKLCWKCLDTNHNSFDCSLPDCICGRKHDQSLCSQSSEKDLHRRETWNRNNTSWQRNTHGGDNFTRDSNRVLPNYSRENNDNLRKGQGNANHSAALELQDMAGPNDVHQHILQQNHTAFIAKGNKQASIPTLMTCEAQIFSHPENRYITCTIFFDSGAQQTLVNEHFASRLGIEEGEINVFTMSGVNENTERFMGRKIRLELQATDKSQVYFTALTKPFISKGFSSAKLDEADHEFLKNRQIILPVNKTRGEMQRPDILIGADNYNQLVKNKTAIILPSGLQLVDTLCGYCLFGSPCERSVEEVTCSNHSGVIEPIDNELSPNELLKQMYGLESLGIIHDGSPADTAIIEYYENYKKFISFENGIVTAPFPLKSDLSRLGENYSLAYKRLLSLINSFETNPEKGIHYKKIIDQYISDEIVEEVTMVGNPKSIGTYYIPHHGVWNFEKENKPLRIVFDASAKQKGSISLNESIETGEIFVNKIQDILMTARKGKYIITCDIQAAFTQIRLVDQHQDLCRFLWIKEMHKGLTKDNLKMYRFKRLPFGITASPSILNMAILSFLESTDEDIAYEILKLIYVDNVIFLADSIESIHKKIRESKEIFQKISLNLREYVTNVPEINYMIPATDQGRFGDTKILGINFNTDSDKFTLSITVKIDDATTKRTVLRQLHSIYDPIGVLAPAIILLRCAMRDIFHSTTHWSDKLNPELSELWENLIKRYNNTKVSIPRYLGDKHSIMTDQILWIFTDASIKAFAACAYLQNKHSFEVSNLISGKAKLTPKAKVPLEDTIPKFEFSSILLGVELAKNVMKNLEGRNMEIFLVNDSTSALSWVHSTKQLKRSCNLIREKINRSVNDIRTKYASRVTFFHCPTDLNVADIGSRGCVPQILQESDWVTGPKWIQKNLEELPLTSYCINADLQNCLEELEQPIVVNQVIVKELANLCRAEFSSTFVGCRAHARLLNMLKRKLEKTRKVLNSPVKLNSAFLTAVSGELETRPDDLVVAELFILLSEQVGYDVEQLNKRHKGKQFFKDKNGLIRFQSRLQYAELSENVKNPIFLPIESNWLKRTTEEIHSNQGHCGKEFLKMFIRQKYWIPKPGKMVNMVVRNCLECRKANCLPFKAPVMSSLPPDRVQRTNAFANTGVDCLGPFETKEKEKVYICLFTCLVFRGVHLEVIMDMSGSEFLNAFIRFIARRGVPNLMRSDNGTNFVLGEKLITALINNQEFEESIMRYCSNNKFSWIFNPPEASWFGGAWERLVKSVKLSFYKTVGRNILSISEFNTLIIKIEGVINSRPLTTFDNDKFIQPLRPIDFICPGLIVNLPSFNKTVEDEDYNPDEILTITNAKKVLSKIEHLFESFLVRFQNEYLPLVRDNQKHVILQGRCSTHRAPRVNEIVLIKDRLLPRHKWNVGRIVKLKKSRDGEIRSAVVDCENKRLHRPIIHLFPLELNLAGKEGVSDSEVSRSNIYEPAEPDIGKVNLNMKNGVVKVGNKRHAHTQALENIKGHAKRELLEVESSDSESFNSALQINTS